MYIHETVQKHSTNNTKHSKYKYRYYQKHTLKPLYLETRCCDDSAYSRSAAALSTVRDALVRHPVASLYVQRNILICTVLCN